MIRVTCHKPWSGPVEVKVAQIARIMPAPGGGSIIYEVDNYPYPIWCLETVEQIDALRRRLLSNAGDRHALAWITGSGTVASS